YDYGPALRRARDVERTADGEVFALMVGEMDLVRIEEDAALFVDDDGVILIGVPEVEDEIDHFFGALVAIGVCRMTGNRKVLRDIGPGSHHIPGCETLADVIERGELAGKEVRVLVSGRCGGHKADMTGDLR